MTLFDTTRHWAYKAIRLYRSERRSRLRSAWETKVLNYLHGVNSEFTTPLNYSEVKATAKSIAKYCWRLDPKAERNFLQRQAERGRLGGLAKGKANEQKRGQARLMAANGFSSRQIAREVGVNQSTIVRWLKQG